MGSGVFAAPKNGGPALDAPIRSFGGRRKQHGSNASGTTKQAAAGFECGQTKTYGTKEIPGQFKVEMPKGRVRYIRGWR